VEIGPEGGRRHNSPPRRKAEATLGSEQRNYGLDTTFSTFTDATLRLLLSLLLLLSRNEERKKETLSKPKAERLAGAFGALFSLLRVRFITRGSLFIGGPWA
jgi:hypothetical protein